MTEHLDLELRFSDSDWWPNVVKPRLSTDQIGQIEQSWGKRKRERICELMANSVAL